jgi:hypothetical protein
MDNMSEKSLRILIVVFALLFLYTSVMWSNENIDCKNQKVEIQKLTKEVDSLQILNDSLNMELFPAEVELGRYQIAYEIFLERNPKAASQFGDIISNETE